MPTYDLKDEHVAEYFGTAKERYEILLRRRDGQEKPWSVDPVFREWYFCNVFREDDKVTTWIREKVRQPLHDSPSVMWAMALCRLVNKVETLEILRRARVFETKHFDGVRMAEALKDVSPIVGAAYVVKTPDGMDKLNGIISMVREVSKDHEDILTRLEGQATLKQIWQILQRFKCFGSFMAYEVTSDLRWTYLLENAPDITTWAAPGPGACLGLSKLTNQTVSYGTARDRAAAIEAMQCLVVLSRVEELWPQDWPEWEMREAEHWLCEYAKYVKVKHEGKRMKRRYRG